MITVPPMVALTIAGSVAGLFQMGEMRAFDYFISRRPEESSSSRIVIVTIDEPDLHNYNFPIPDHQLAQAIEIIKKQQPRVIGLDIYRDMPVEPGTEELSKVFRETNNLIGIEKATDQFTAKSVNPPHSMPADRVAISNIVVDPDGKVRRALLSIERENGDIQLGIATELALIYLAQDNIFPETVKADNSSSIIQLGKTQITPFRSDDGGYVNADNGGYQILLNYRGGEDKFPTVSFTDVLEGKLPRDWAKNRIVLIGSKAESLNDKFYTPYNNKDLFGNNPIIMAGVFIHANMANQLLDAALEGRPLIRVVAEPLETLWVIFWGLVGASISWLFFEQKSLNFNVALLGNLLIVSIILPSGILVGISYLAFVQGWWIPVFTPFIALTLSALALPSYKNYELKRIACLDGLTQIANRRHFDQYYEQVWERLKAAQQPLSVILCDIDYFKFYNDQYGHQAGDRCLQQVAQTLAKAVRSTDFVARYGGEEFIIVLPSTDGETAYKIGQRICSQVRSLQIPHSKSRVSHIVTLSCGVATLIPDTVSSSGILIATADSALYEAKEKGRNGVVLK